jgi:hypothetical protein
MPRAACVPRSTDGATANGRENRAPAALAS